MSEGCYGPPGQPFTQRPPPDIRRPPRASSAHPYAGDVMPRALVRSFSRWAHRPEVASPMRFLLTRFRVLAVAAALATAPALAITAAPAAHASTSTVHRKPARLKALAYAKRQLGDPYRFGAAGPNAFDCSGLTMKAYSKAGRHIGGH